MSLATIIELSELELEMLKSIALNHDRPEGAVQEALKRFDSLYGAKVVQQAGSRLKELGLAKEEFMFYSGVDREFWYLPTEQGKEVLKTASYRSAS